MDIRRPEVEVVVGPVVQRGDVREAREGGRRGRATLLVLCNLLRYERKKVSWQISASAIEMAALALTHAPFPSLQRAPAGALLVARSCFTDGEWRRRTELDLVRAPRLSW